MFSRLLQLILAKFKKAEPVIVEALAGADIITSVIGEFESQIARLDQGVELVRQEHAANLAQITRLAAANDALANHENRAVEVRSRIASIIAQ